MRLGRSAEHVSGVGAAEPLPDPLAALAVCCSQEVDEEVSYGYGGHSSPWSLLKERVAPQDDAPDDAFSGARTAPR